MARKLLRRAREYEETNRPLIRPQLPACHVTGGVGWINDPNGFAPYRGEYHLFFQYHPYDNCWGPMHWGHAKTKDFIRWELLPAALAPDQDYDRDGCFSGGAVELPDGRHLLMYTGVRRIPVAGGRQEDRQTQCVAIGDGLDYEKYAGNPVLTAADLPEGGSAIDFRDPKIWREGDTFYCVVVNRTPDGSGAVLLYESPDGLRWKRNGVISQCRSRYGRMWECPDFFRLDGKDVLLHSAQKMLAQGLEFHGGNNTLFHIGRLDRENWEFLDETVHAGEYGLDFYAPQTLEAADGRRILIGWMQSWESARERPDGLGFLGQMTVPRELRIKNGRVCQMPVRELGSYRKNRVSYSGVRIEKKTTLPGIRGRILDMTLRIRPEGAQYRRFDLEIAKNDRFVTTISLLPETGTIRLDRTYSGFRHDILHTREFPAAFPGEGIRLRLLLDRCSAELFVGDGEQAASMVLYTPAEAEDICLRADKPVVVDVEKYDLMVE